MYLSALYFPKSLLPFQKLFFNARRAEVPWRSDAYICIKGHFPKPYIRGSRSSPFTQKSHQTYSDVSIFAKLPRSPLNFESSPAPKHIIPKAAITTLSLALLITLLNMNSCAINSTSPVYISIPALILSKTPSTTSPVCDPGAYVFLTPNPTAIDIGVDKTYPTAKRYGVHRFALGQGVAASRDPRPRPSNVWWNTRTM